MYYDPQRNKAKATDGLSQQNANAALSGAGLHQGALFSGGAFGCYPAFSLGAVSVSVPSAVLVLVYSSVYAAVQRKTGSKNRPRYIIVYSAAVLVCPVAQPAVSAQYHNFLLRCSSTPMLRAPDSSFTLACTKGRCPLPSGGTRHSRSATPCYL